jgi:tRNA(Ile)-lysidine synthase
MNRLNELTYDLKPYSQDRFLLAVSGGLDSMALFSLFLHFKKHFSFDFAVAHFHHGPHEVPSIQDYRFQAAHFVKKACDQHEVGFFCNIQSAEQSTFLNVFEKPLNSEQELRQARYQFLESVRVQEGFRWIVTAHHQDDLLETRLMRLIRGTGPEGLQAMRLRDGDRLRPLLHWSRQELSAWIQERGEEWIEDPSNQDWGSLRNWIRGFWLPELEKKQPGGTACLSRSLNNIVSNSNPTLELSDYISKKSLILAEWLTLNTEQKRQILASYMKSQGLKNYGLSHINEVIKRLDREEKNHSFKLLGRRWKVDAGRMSLEA